jgi:rSAM/selenodomain-associated transferase 2
MGSALSRLETAMKPLTSLSIVLPVLNEAAQIEHVLRRLEEARAHGVEVIVVDGGSADDTVQLAASYVDQLLHSAQGRARQMNAGAASAQGDVLLFLHADTLLPEGAYRLLLAELNRSQKAWGRFDVQISGRSQMFGLIAATMNLRSRLTGIATGDQAIFIRRADFESVGGFPEQELMEDIEISRRLKYRSPPLCLCGPAVTSGRRWEERGVWRTIMLMWRLRLLYWLGTPANKLAERYR